MPRDGQAVCVLRRMKRGWRHFTEQAMCQQRAKEGAESLGRRGEERQLVLT